MNHIDYSKLPDHMRDGAQLYIEHRVPPGEFLTAVLENNFVDAVARADDVNSHNLITWAQWLYWECPRAAWGSPEKVAAWLSGTVRPVGGSLLDAIRDARGAITEAEGRK
jgi:hypothetical protein